MRRVVEYTRAGSAIGPSLAVVFVCAEAEERDDEAADANEWFDGLRWCWCWWEDNGTASARFLLAPVLLPGVPVAEGEARGVPDAPEAGGRGGRSSDAGVGPLCRRRCCSPVPSFALGVGGVRPSRCPAMIDQEGQKSPPV